MIGADRAALVKEVSQALERPAPLPVPSTRLGSPEEFSPEANSWGYAGPYTLAYATFGPQGYHGPIAVTHSITGRSKTITVQAVYMPSIGPTDQEVERAVIATLQELAKPVPVYGDVLNWLKKNWPWALGGTLAITAVAIVASK